MSKRRIIFIVFSFLLIVLLLSYAIFFNLFDLFTKKSESFSFERFNSIQIDQPISDAIALLGEPIAREEAKTCDGCMAYVFMGEYPDWVIGGTECWYVADSTGKIVTKLTVIEP